MVDSPRVKLQLAIMDAVSMQLAANLARAIYSSQGALPDEVLVAISSRGGSTDAALFIVHCLQGLSSLVTTHAIGAVESAAATVFSAGNRRRATSASRFLLHDVRVSLDGSYQEPELRRIEHRIALDRRTAAGVIAESTSAPAARLKEMMVESRELTSEDALQLGLVSEIRDDVFDPDVEVIRLASVSA